MKKMIAFCGINCAECPTLLATQENDDKKRIKIAKRWSLEYEKHRDLKPEEINCNGCLTKHGILFKSCKVCPIRECGMERKIANCAYCGDYSCQKLNNFLIEVPYGKANLDEIKKTL